MAFEVTQPRKSLPFLKMAAALSSSFALSAKAVRAPRAAKASRAINCRKVACAYTGAAARGAAKLPLLPTP